VYCYKDSPGLDCPAVETMATGRPVTLREVKKQGRYFQVVTTPLKSQEGEITGVIEVLIDVTEKKKAEELMLRTEKLVSLGQMAAGIAHELNTPLGNILGYARLLQKDPTLSSKQAERVEIIAEQANRCSRIIKGLLDFARKPDYERDSATCSVADAIETAITLLEKEASKRQIDIHFQPKRLPPVRGHPREIEQVFVNIILNALQAIGNRGEVTIKAFERDNHVVVEVSDTGPGIPEDIRDRIFDPFFTTKPPGEGTGLGLSISAGTMNRLGGGIEVENSKDNGAVFKLLFPIQGGSGR
ncbi:MAG: PAS domain-containing sensor histidine kinase, partial [Nitrospirae bacterium]